MVSWKSPNTSLPRRNKFIPYLRFTCRWTGNGLWGWQVKCSVNYPFCRECRQHCYRLYRCRWRCWWLVTPRNVCSWCIYLSDGWSGRFYNYTVLINCVNKILSLLAFANLIWKWYCGQMYLCKADPSRGNGINEGRGIRTVPGFKQRFRHSNWDLIFLFIKLFRIDERNIF